MPNHLSADALPGGQAAAAKGLFGLGRQAEDITGERNMLLRVSVSLVQSIPRDSSDYRPWP